MTFIEFCTASDPKGKIKPGTFAAQQQLARYERDHEVLASIKGESAKLCACVMHAVDHAYKIIMASRSAQAHPAGYFVADFVRLDAYCDYLNSVASNSKAAVCGPKIPPTWPAVAGFALAWNAVGNSALEAAWRLAWSVHNACVCARGLHRIASHGEPYASQPAGTNGQCGPDIVGWTGKAMEELRMHLYPPPSEWPDMAALHKARSVIQAKLRDEYERARDAVARLVPKRRLTGKYLKDKPITQKMKEAVDMMVTCVGNKTEAAGRLGISRATLDERLEAVKLRGELSKTRSVATQRLPHDARGQITEAAGRRGCAGYA